MSEPSRHTPHHAPSLSRQPSQRYHPYPSGTTSTGFRGLEQPQPGYLTSIAPSESGSGPARGWLGHNGAISFPAGDVTPAASNVPPMIVDTIATEQGLSGTLNAKTQGSADVQRAELHAHQLATDNKVKLMQDSLSKVKETTEEFSKTLVETWKPNESQKKIVRDLCWNYLTYDLDSYLQLHSLVEAVIEKDPTATLNLPDYKKNVALTEGVNSYIRSEASNIKSRFKKKMDNAVASRQPLEELTRAVLKAHRTNFTSSSSIDDTHKAVFANYRDVASRLQKQPTAESDAGTSPQAQSEGDKRRTLRADSGYWKMLDDETGKRLETLGNDRANDKWAEWRRDVIVRDENRYGIQRISTNALRDATMTDASGGYLQNAAPES